MGSKDLEAFLTHLAVAEQVSAATQHQAFRAVLFLYRAVLKRDLGDISAIRAKRSSYLPTVLSRAEALNVIAQRHGVHQLVVQLLYGSGLRLNEALRLRIKDVDFAQRQLVLRDTKGQESRVTMLPACVAEPLPLHNSIELLTLLISH